MVVHLGVLGWQQAFSPVGLSPGTQQVGPHTYDRAATSGFEGLLGRAMPTPNAPWQNLGEPPCCGCRTFRGTTICVLLRSVFSGLVPRGDKLCCCS